MTLAGTGELGEKRTGGWGQRPQIGRSAAVASDCRSAESLSTGEIFSTRYPVPHPLLLSIARAGGQQRCQPIETIRNGITVAIRLDHPNPQQNFHSGFDELAGGRARGARRRRPRRANLVCASIGGRA